MSKPPPKPVKPGEGGAGGSRAGRGAPRSVCSLAGQGRHVLGPEPRVRDPPAGVGVAALAPGVRSREHFRGI